MPDTERGHALRTPVGPAIAKATGHLLNEFTGRGPTMAHAYVSDELISVVLNDSMTAGERSLLRDGGGGLVLALRKAYQEAMGPALIAAVEALSGQRVIAFLSANHLDPDIAVESFVLVPPAAGRDAERSHGHGVAVGA
jgi:uncharacterized protein YbcI